MLVTIVQVVIHASSLQDFIHCLNVLIETTAFLISVVQNEVPKRTHDDRCGNCDGAPK